MPPLPPKPPPFLHPHRVFSSTPNTSLPSRTRAANLVRDGLLTSSIPPYPYGPSPIYRQSNHGLYGLQKIRFGNKVSIKNEIKTRRFWRPNVQVKSLYSECLERMVKVKVTTRTLRTIDKSGGLDGYLLAGKTRRIRELGVMGWRLRWRVMVSERCREMFRREGKRLEEVRGRVGKEMVEEVKRFDELLEEGEEIAVGEGSEEVGGDDVAARGAEKGSKSVESGERREVLVE